ncbi:MAG: hypothetical protein UT61_C0021G0019 [Candidatus Woesebacteria bacterium GW2011_GWA1_39_8]|uniref:DUF5680 domain-containing protein n=1 Tax=Candidatus Woesebacteria bacterium GW2011_GWA1_39_8 TaxID=1618552 RepID=A0A0G0PPJ8_9BACT|nr:MAG: hypothetical protein UT61_C0021G0019 [Candidatus Woesebacteria bacterium GW2011_GWA1_39_8]
MTPAQRDDILEGAKKAFFEAMMDGWVGEGNRRSIKTKDDDGYVTITYETEDGKYKVVDRYCTTLSDRSGGTTTIFFRTSLIWIAVWWMAYGGHYPESTIPFLKHALKENYEGRVFNGGRGPAYFPFPPCQEERLYTNHFYGDFTSFRGEESINSFKPNEVGRIGFHKYFGMSFL